MELKPFTFMKALSFLLLLIVPYGIETNGKNFTLYRRIFLLIVPYGIETHEPGQHIYL